VTKPVSGVVLTLAVTNLAMWHFAATTSSRYDLAPGTSLGISSVPNLRDVGGYTTRDGSVVRRGIAYRSDQLNPITPGDMKKLAALGLRKDLTFVQLQSGRNALMNCHQR
jgi:Tyrosine phosphatase family